MKLLINLSLMIRKSISVLILGLAAFGLNAAPISPEAALARLGGNAAKMAAKDAGKTLRPVHTALTAEGSPAVYIFNRGDKGGYMLLAADDLAYPLLGYSDSGSFDASEMPPQMKWWLEEYGRQIEFASKKGISPLQTTMRSPMATAREAIAPQLKTKWDQTAPFNDQCPKYGTERLYTGCVATSMAQVMKYWNYPEVGQGSISYDSPSLGKRLEMNFARRNFDWAQMADSYAPGSYTDAQAQAVAYLMKAAGYSVKMDYATDASGALAMNISNALVKYFKYDPNIRYDLRMYHNSTEWEQLIYDNLKNVGPVLYGGGSYLGGGHSFVCDGYDGNGLFHFNWGWSGMSDGYFSLDALNPGSLGAGGGAGGGYNFTQDAVLGIQPPTGKPAEVRPLQLAQMGSLTADVENDSIKFALFGEADGMWVNYNPVTMKVKFGAIFDPQGNTPGTTVVKEISKAVPSIDPGYGSSPNQLKTAIKLPIDGLSDGTYKVTIATLLTDEDGAEWTPVKPCYGYYNFVTVKKQGQVYTTDSNPIVTLDILDVQMTEEIYYGGLTKVKMKISNDSDLELSRGFAPALFKDGYAYFLGESQFITVAPHSEVEHEWVTSLTLLQKIQGIAVDTDFELVVFDESTYNFFRLGNGKTVTMHPNPGLPRIIQNSPAQLRSTLVKEEVPGFGEQNVYLVEDPNDMQVTASFTLNSGIFCYNIMACIVNPDFLTNENGSEILNSATEPFFVSNPGGSIRVRRMPIGYPSMEPGRHYAMVMAFLYVGQTAGIPDALGKVPVTYFRLASSGVNDIEESVGTENCDGVIYNLQGMPVGKDADALPAGIYIRNGKKFLKK